MSSVIERAPVNSRKIVRQQLGSPVRSESEVQSAMVQVGYMPHNNVRSWYRDIYDFYQNNEC